MILHDGKAVLRKKLEDGSFRTCAHALLNDKSVYSRVLKVLHSMGTNRSAKEITRLYSQRYETNISSNQVAARLSELFTLGLVQRVQNPKDKRVALYSVVPSIDVADKNALYKRAVVRLSHIRDFTRFKLSTLSKPPSFVLIKMSFSNPSIVILSLRFKYFCLRKNWLV